MMVVDANGCPYDSKVTHINTKAAERYATRRIGKDWRERGWKVVPWKASEHPTDGELPLTWGGDW